MKRNFKVIALLIVGIAIITIFLSNTQKNTAPEYKFTRTETGFIPKELTVPLGSTVVFINKTNTHH